MSDDNVVNFEKILKASKSENAGSLEERVLQCFQNEECECLYCNYRTNAAEMVVEFLSRDLVTFEDNNNAQLCTFDLKDVFFKAIHLVKQMEKEREPRGE